MEFPLRKVVYTCVCGDYDQVKAHTYVDKSWDYVCYTDNQQLIKEGHPFWTIRPLAFSERDHTRNGRWHKILPHRILYDYDISFYIDGNVDILNSFMFDYIDRDLIPNEEIALAINPHPERNCIYDEAVACRVLKLDQPQLIDAQMEILKSLKYPSNNGLTDSCMIYRRHNDARLMFVMEDWWEWVSSYSRRDQLSFNFIVWMHNFNFHLFKQNFARDQRYFRHFAHKGVRYTQLN